MWQAPGPEAFLSYLETKLERTRAWDRRAPAAQTLPLLHGEHRPCPSRTMLNLAARVPAFADEAELRLTRSWELNSKHDQHNTN